MQMMNMGFSQIDITPNKPVQTIGFGRKDETSRGILDKLFAQVSIWQIEKVVCCLVAIDHIGFGSGHAKKLRKEIGEMLEIESQKVMLCFSHTHSAPNDSIEIEYAEYVDENIKKAVKEAIANMEAVKAGWGNAYGDIGINRRVGSNECDRRIGILKVVDKGSEELKLILLRLTAHSNVLKEDNYLISSDFFGAVRELLSNKYNCPVMVTQGASGNIAPKYFNSKVNPPDVDNSGRFVRTENALNCMAEEVFRQVYNKIGDIETCDTQCLNMYSVNKEFFADVPTYRRAEEVADEANRYAGIDGRQWLCEVKRLNDKGIKAQIENIEIQYFVLNNGCLCGVPNEIMCEFALRASEKMKNERFYFGGYTNGCTGYFPIEEEYDLGGFEVYWSMLIFYIYHGRVFPLNRNSATELINAAVENAKS